MIKNLLEYYDCKNCDIIMGDLNLNPRENNDQLRLAQLCQNGQLEILLHEPTIKSYNQPDHIFGEKLLKGKIF